MISKPRIYINFEQKWSTDKKVSKDTRFTFLTSIKKKNKTKEGKISRLWFESS